MRGFVRRYAWIVVVGATAAAALLTAFQYLEFGRTRYFNAVVLTMAWTAWMTEYMAARSTYYRRQRRLRLAFAGVLASGAYGSLDAALTQESNPTLRIILISISSGWTLAAILFHPDDDFEIPDDVTFPWEPWLLRQVHRLMGWRKG